MSLFVLRFFRKARELSVPLLIFVFGLWLTAVIRAKLFDFHSGDLDRCLLVWADAIKKDGFAHALKHSSINYNPPYIYLLWLAPRVPLDRSVVIKLFSVLCDYACAVLLAFIVYRLYRSKLRAGLAAFALLIAPSVVFNGAGWAQCDMVYTVFLVAGLAAQIVGRSYLMMALFALAFAVKLQALFLFPLLGIWLLRKEVPWRAVVVFPIVFLVSLIPAWAAGCDLRDLLMVYPNQSQDQSCLTCSAPTLLVFLPDNQQWLAPFSKYFTLAWTFLVAVACVYSRERTTPKLNIKQAAVFACLVPYFLPYMHERYFFIADVFCVLYGFAFPRRFWVPLVVVGCSFLSYFPYLFGATPVPFGVTALMLGGTTGYLTFDLVCSLYPRTFRAKRLPTRSSWLRAARQSHARTLSKGTARRFRRAVTWPRPSVPR